MRQLTLEDGGAVASAAQPVAATPSLTRLLAKPLQVLHHIRMLSQRLLIEFGFEDLMDKPFAVRSNIRNAHLASAEEQNDNR